MPLLSLARLLADERRWVVTDMLIAMLGICSKEELDEEEVMDEEEAEATPEEPVLTGPSPSHLSRVNRTDVGL